MIAGWGSAAGDPGRVHSEGRGARVIVEQAREQVAALLGARPREVIFTSGATEAIATAAWGAAERGPHTVVSAVEHSAVLESAAVHGPVTAVGVDGLGRVDPGEVAAAIRPGETGLVCVQAANHEVGTCQPLAEVIGACRARAPEVLIHVDAAAAAGHMALDFAGLGADLMSVSAHKFGGPQGIGALLVRRGLRLRPLMVGGDQERARRAGLENVGAIAGFGAAAAELSGSGADGIVNESTRARGRGVADTGTADALDAGTGARTQTYALAVEGARNRAQTYALAAAALAVDGVHRLGDPDLRLPHILCLGIDGVEAEPVLIGLDRAGIAAHSGSSCSSESLQPSPVLAAMGADSERSLRVSVGWSTTDEDVAAFTRAFPEVVADLRSLMTGD